MVWGIGCAELEAISDRWLHRRWETRQTRNGYRADIFENLESVWREVSSSVMGAVTADMVATNVSLKPVPTSSFSLSCTSRKTSRTCQPSIPFTGATVARQSKTSALEGEHSTVLEYFALGDESGRTARSRVVRNLVAGLKNRTISTHVALTILAAETYQKDK